MRAELMLTVARTYHGLAMYPEAIALLTEARTICSGIDCRRNALSARIDFRLGQNLGFTGEPQRALNLLNAAAQEVSDPALLAKIADETASALWSTGDREGTVAMMERAVQLYETAAGASPDVLVAVSYTRLGSLYSNLGQLEQALARLEKGARLYESLNQNALPELADLYNEISILYSKRGQSDKAREYLLQAYEVIERIDGVSEIEIRILTNLGITAPRSADHSLAREWLAKSKTALAQFTSADSDHEASAWVLHLEGIILAQEEKYAESLSFYEQELAIYEQLMPAYNHSHATTGTSMGLALENLGRLEDALQRYQRVFDYYSEIYEEEESTYLSKARERVERVKQRIAAR